MTLYGRFWTQSKQTNNWTETDNTHKHAAVILDSSYFDATCAAKVKTIKTSQDVSKCFTTLPFCEQFTEGKDSCMKL